MKVLIINQGGGLGNFGDDAILKGMCQYLLDQGHQCRHATFSQLSARTGGSIKLKKNKPVYLVSSLKRAGMFFIKPFKRILLQLLWINQNINRIRQECINGVPDIALIGGGELIQSNGIFPMALWMWTYFLKQRAKTPCFLFAVGVSENISWFGKLLVWHASQRVKGVYVRDEMSLRRWNSMTANAKADIAYDPAFLLPQKMKEHSRELCLVLFSPTSYKFYSTKCFEGEKMSENRYTNYWLNLLHKYVRKGSKVALISTNCSQDPPFHNNLARSYLKQYGADIQCLQAENLEEFRRYLAKSDSIISGRLHALILAYIQGVKVIPFFTSSKMKYHYESIFKTNKSIEDLNKITRLALNNCCFTIKE